MILTAEIGGVFVVFCFVFYKEQSKHNNLWSLWPNSSILISLVNRTCKMHQACLEVPLQTSNTELCSEDNGPRFP